MIGQQLSHYEILSRIGETPAGPVYKARDREASGFVSIRQLAPGVTANPDQRRRIQEAVAAVSGVSQPNLARLYEFASADNQDFIVGELVEGESLDTILRRERLHRRDLFEFARQIAGALEALHSAGLIHGGLNSARVVLDAQRRIKVLDAGVAPLLRIEGEELPPEIACFCSPEQVEGEELDARSDIFSFGALLYYMTTRRRPFRRETFAETLEAVLKEEPRPVDSLTKHAPRGIEKIIRRCLRKTPVRRYQQVADIDGPLIKLALAYESKAQPGGSRRSERTGILPWIFAGAAVLALAAGGLFWFQSLSFKRNDQVLTQVTLDTGYDAEPTISSSARQVAYASDRSGEGNLDIWIQPLSSQTPVRLTRDPADDREPSLAPDGATVAFRSERDPAGIYLVPASGGDARLLVPEGRSPRFSPDGKWIAYWTSQSDAASKVYAISPDGGQPRPIAPDFAAAHPVWSPDSRSILFLGRKTASSSASDDDWWVTSIDPGDPLNTGGCRAFRQHAILRAEACPPPGDWKNKSVYFTLPDERGSNVWQAEILASRDITAKPVEVTSGDGIHVQPTATDEGKVLFSKQSLNVDIWGVPLHANEGKLGGQWKKLTSDPSTDVFPSLSANGTKLLFQSNRRGGRTAWVRDMNSRIETPILVERNELLWPRLSPDGSRLSFAQEALAGYDRFVMPVTGGNPEPLCRSCGRGMDWSRDGKSALIEDTSSKSIVLVKIGSNIRIPLLQPRPGGTLAEPRYSPDQRSIAFAERTESAASRIYLAPLRGESATPSVEWLPLTKDKSWEAAPQWSPDSKLIYFISNRDGHRCIWARHAEEAKTGAGEPFAVHHFHDTRLSPANSALDGTDLFVGSDQIVISLGELSGSLWMLTPRQ